VVPLQKGYVLSRKYEVVDFIGRGLIFEVYKARHTRLSKDVALKILLPEIASDLEFTRFVIHTIQNTASLDEHPHISWVLDIDKDGIYIYFVLDYLPKDLSVIINELDIDRALYITNSILDALKYAHSKGLIHKDIRPSNVRLTESDEPVLVDFGMAEIAARAALRFKKTAFIPPPNYIAPEQIKSFELADHRSDIYSVGALLYHMLTKKPPFEGDIKQIYYQKLSGRYTLTPPRSLNPSIPKELEDFILRAMDPDPSNRFQSVEEMMDALKGFSRRIVRRFVSVEFEERRPEGSFRRSFEIVENLPFSLEYIECGSVMKTNEPFKLSLMFSGEGEGRVEIKVPEYISLSSLPSQNFKAPCEVSWYLITTKEIYGYFDIEIRLMYEGYEVLKEPLKIPVLIFPIESKEKKGTKKTSFRIFGFGG